MLWTASNVYNKRYQTEAVGGTQLNLVPVETHAILYAPRSTFYKQLRACAQTIFLILFLKDIYNLELWKAFIFNKTGWIWKSKGYWWSLTYRKTYFFLCYLISSTLLKSLQTFVDTDAHESRIWTQYLGLAQTLPLTSPVPHHIAYSRQTFQPKFFFRSLFKALIQYGLSIYWLNLISFTSDMSPYFTIMKT